MSRDSSNNIVEKSLVNAEDQLAFVRALLDRHALNSAARGQIARHIEAIERRRHDRSLYLAVVGEFNSGKSTFINALLRDPLLKARIVATTAAETRLVHGKELAIEVTGAGGETFTLCESAGRCPDYRWFTQVSGLTAREVIPVATDEGQSANLVRRVTIGHPAAFLADGTVLIDTPGTNATYQAHGAITTRIIEDQADMAVILIPANQSVSLTLIDFLNGPLKSLLHRCIFVLTKMDLVPEREQGEVSEFARARLSEALGRQDVMILPSAPQVVLDCADPACEVRPIDRQWEKSF